MNHHPDTKVARVSTAPVAKGRGGEEPQSACAPLRQFPQQQQRPEQDRGMDRQQCEAAQHHPRHRYLGQRKGRDRRAIAQFAPRFRGEIIVEIAQRGEVGLAEGLRDDQRRRVIQQVPPRRLASDRDRDHRFAQGIYRGIYAEGGQPRRDWGGREKAGVGKFRQSLRNFGFVRQRYVR